MLCHPATVQLKDGSGHLIVASFLPSHDLAITFAIPTGLHFDRFIVQFGTFAGLRLIVDITASGGVAAFLHLILVHLLLIVVCVIAAFAINRFAVAAFRHKCKIRLRTIELAVILSVIVKTEFTFGHVSIELEYRNDSKWTPDIHLGRWWMNDAVKA